MLTKQTERKLVIGTVTYNATTGNLATKAGVSYGYNDAAHTHAVTHLGGVQKYWYDANGNQTKRIIGADTYDLSYDAENRLVEVKKNSSVYATFVYNADGQRVKSSVNGVSIAYVGRNAEWSNNALTSYYYAGAAQIAMRQSGELIYMFGDHLGSTSKTYKVSNGETKMQLYYPWGERRYPTAASEISSRYRYTGQYEYSELGLYFYQSRWYDATLGRFAQADTIVPNPGDSQAWDRYAYVNNSPLRYTDPSGHFKEEEIPLLCIGCETVDDLIEYYGEEIAEILMREDITFDSYIIAGDENGATDIYVFLLLGGNFQNRDCHNLGFLHLSTGNIVSSQTALSHERYVILSTNNEYESGYNIQWCVGISCDEGMKWAAPFMKFSGFKGLGNEIKESLLRNGKNYTYSIYTDISFLGIMQYAVIVRLGQLTRFNLITKLSEVGLASAETINFIKNMDNPLIDNNYPVIWGDDLYTKAGQTYSFWPPSPK